MTKSQGKPLSKKFRFPVQVLLGILVLAAIAYAIMVTGPTDDTVVPVPPAHTPVPTAFPLHPVVASDEELPTSNQTDGVIIGAASVMLILVAGTIVALYPSLKKK